MRDAISGLIGRYDKLGRYFDRAAIDRIDAYYAQASLRLAAVELINREATTIVREASQRLWQDNPELILPGGNAYTTRRLAACLRDMDYFLRYASYALIADDVTILDERVLNGLDDTYKSLGVARDRPPGRCGGGDAERCRPPRQRSRAGSVRPPVPRSGRQQRAGPLGPATPLHSLISAHRSAAPGLARFLRPAACERRPPARAGADCHPRPSAARAGPLQRPSDGA